MEHKVICEKPNTIVNPAIGTFVHCNKCYAITTYRDPYRFYETDLFSDSYCASTEKTFKRLKKFVRKNDIQYFMNEEGECMPCFIQVPCGNCRICQNRKRNDFATRCSLETQCYNSLPLFITLTYNDDTMPTDGLNYPDVQRFLKRIRIDLERNHNYTEKLRYALCGEYGKTTQRPHYHILLYGFPMTAFHNNLYEIDKYIRNKWSKGLTQTKVCKNSDAGFYVGKYMGKKDKTPESKTPEFHHSSIRLGQSVVKTHIKYLYDNNDVYELQYFDKWSQKVKKIPMVKSFVNAFLPSVSMSIPKQVRDSFCELVSCLTLLKSTRYWNISEYVARFDSLNIKMPKSLHFVSKVYSPLDNIRMRVEQSLATLEKYANTDYSNADFIHRRRNIYYTQLMLNTADIDISHLAYTLEKRSAIEDSKPSYL